jgi:hypothetical protein
MDEGNKGKSASAVGVKATYFIVTHSYIPEEGHSNHAVASSSSVMTTSTTTTSTTNTSRTFDCSNTKEARVGLAIGSKPSAQPLPGDYSYSGVHDQGPLPGLKQGGPMAELLGCLEAAKEYNNTFMTTLLEQEKKNQPKHTMTSVLKKSSLGPSSSKKSKTSKDDECSR